MNRRKIRHENAAKRWIEPRGSKDRLRCSHNMSFVRNQETLCSEIAAWSTDVNRRQRGVDWQMDIDDARRKLKSIYPNILM